MQPRLTLPCLFHFHFHFHFHFMADCCIPYKTHHLTQHIAKAKGIRLLSLKRVNIHIDACSCSDFANTNANANANANAHAKEGMWLPIRFKVRDLTEAVDRRRKLHIGAAFQTIVPFIDRTDDFHCNITGTGDSQLSILNSQLSTLNIPALTNLFVDLDHLTTPSLDPGKSFGTIADLMVTLPMDYDTPGAISNNTFPGCRNT